ncbi:aspartate carbamoyltransferase [Clostridia bacterium]|nr:aspartate carbamoyltransferase [Clostridia bacterium]
MLKGKHLIEPFDFSLEELEQVFDLADQIIQSPERFLDACKGRILATLFYEPSTRTRFSFEAAMQRLGGQVIGFDDPSTSSTAKGESLSDTIRTIACYADIAAIRHPREGTAKLASKFTDMPIINAGDGGHQHPTQTLTDLLTIRHYHEEIKDLTVGVCGDLKFGRTIHSLVKALSRYENIHFKMISPEELKMPQYILDELPSDSYELTDSLEAAIGDVDILYMSRVQRERFVSEDEYQRLKDFFILDKNKMKLAKENMIVMHPLPRVNEISKEIDTDTRCVYFEQAKFGMFVRMALIMKLLGASVE